LALDVVRFVRGADLGVLCGVMTPTEVAQARAAGATFLKLFPAGVLGPAYVRQLLGPYPDLELFAVGGISSANAAEFMSAGAAGGWAWGAPCRDGAGRPTASRPPGARRRRSSRRCGEAPRPARERRVAERRRASPDRRTRPGGGESYAVGRDARRALRLARGLGGRRRPRPGGRGHRRRDRRRGRGERSLPPRALRGAQPPAALRAPGGGRRDPVAARAPALGRRAVRAPRPPGQQLRRGA